MGVAPSRLAHPPGFTLPTPAHTCPPARPPSSPFSPRYKSLAELPEGAVVGSAALRRQAQLLAKYPTLQVGGGDPCANPGQSPSLRACASARGRRGLPSGSFRSRLCSRRPTLAVLPPSPILPAGRQLPRKRADPAAQAGGGRVRRDAAGAGGPQAPRPHRQGHLHPDHRGDAACRGAGRHRHRLPRGRRPLGCAAAHAVRQPCGAGAGPQQCAARLAAA